MIMINNHIGVLLIILYIQTKALDLALQLLVNMLQMDRYSSFLLKEIKREQGRKRSQIRSNRVKKIEKEREREREIDY